jgi:hypothetical protein
MLHQAYIESILDLVQYSHRVGFTATLTLLGHDALITRCRNTLVAEFLAVPEATHLLFVDADISFQPEQVHRMLLAEKDIVAGIYPLKLQDWSERARREVLRGVDPETAPLRYVGMAAPEPERRRDGDFVTATWAGTGFMLIRREAILRVIAAHPETAYRHIHAFSNAPSREGYALFECTIDPETGEYLSEDFGFCRTWRQMGGEIWLDTKGELTHTGNHHFRGHPAERFAVAAANGDLGAAVETRRRPG